MLASFPVLLSISLHYSPEEGAFVPPLLSQRDLLWVHQRGSLLMAARTLAAARFHLRRYRACLSLIRRARGGMFASRTER